MDMKTALDARTKGLTMTTSELRSQLGGGHASGAGHSPTTNRQTGPGTDPEFRPSLG